MVVRREVEMVWAWWEREALEMVWRVVGEYSVAQIMAGEKGCGLLVVVVVVVVVVVRRAHSAMLRRAPGSHLAASASGGEEEKDALILSFLKSKILDGGVWKLICSA
jgi:hypothetical protein